MNPPKLTILAADTDAACDPETGTCTIPQTPIPMSQTRDIRDGNLQELESDDREGAEHDERAERQLARPARPAQQEQGDAVGRGEGEREERARDQGLPAEPAERDADAGGELDIFSELWTVVMRVIGLASYY